MARAVVAESGRLLQFVPAPLVVDLCTGSGAIAVTVASEVPQARVIAIDISAEAIVLARTNDEALSAGLIRIEQADATDPVTLADLDGLVDIVVANPPYIPAGGVPRDSWVAKHSPQAALFGGGLDGLDTLRGMLATAARLLRTGGMLALEHADSQAAQVRHILFEHGGFGRLQTRRDDGGSERFALGRRLGPRSSRIQPSENLLVDPVAPD